MNLLEGLRQTIAWYHANRESGLLRAG